MNKNIKLLIFTIMAYGLVTWNLVLAQPVITNQPQSQTNIAGTTAMFTVAVTGAPPLIYQWRSHANPLTFTNIPWGTEATLFLTNVQPTGRRFGVVVTDPSGLSATSTLATLTVLVPPSITNQPMSQTLEVGNAASCAVTATGTAPLYYQWRFNNVALPSNTNTSLVLTNVQFTNSGNYTVVVTNTAGSVTSQVATLTVLPPLFTKITNGAIVNDGGSSIGPAWGDYDNDGWIDLFVANRERRKNFLYRNNRDGTFTKITAGQIVNEAPSDSDSFGAAWGDYDNDGYLDLFVSNCCLGLPVNDFLYRNNGNGAFEKLTTGPVVHDQAFSSTGAWGDYDRDGFLDLFVTAWGPGSSDTHVNFLYRNNGDGTFAGISTGPVATDSGAWSNGVWGDYDNDGWPDLFVSNCCPDSDALYHNNGDGTFTKITEGQIVNESADGTDGVWGDFDNDGYLDLFVANWGQNNFLYRNNGDGSFTPITNGIVVNDVIRHSHSAAWADYDNDGYLDLFVANGQENSVIGENNFLYHNNGDGTFTKVTSGNLGNDGAVSRSCAWGDYDNDGFLDLFVGNGGGPGSADQTNFLYRNNGNSNHWINFRLVGRASNRSGIGAKVRLKATAGRKTFWQLREISGGGSLGQNDLRANFGLGNATNVDAVRIEWPSGTVQELQNVTVNQFLSLAEPPRLQAVGFGPDGSFQFQLTGGVGFGYALETSSNLTAWTPWRTVTNSTRSMLISDLSATNAVRRFYRAVSF